MTPFIFNILRYILLLIAAELHRTLKATGSENRTGMNQAGYPVSRPFLLHIIRTSLQFSTQLITE